MNHEETKALINKFFEQNEEDTIAEVFMGCARAWVYFTNDGEPCNAVMHPSMDKPEVQRELNSKMGALWGLNELVLEVRHN